MKNMLTKSQIKSLKKGDKLLAEVSFINAGGDDDLICSAPLTTSDGAREVCNYYRLSCLSLPPAPPKYDPCRKFKKGDIAKVIYARGRNAGVEVGTQVTVTSDEYCGRVSVQVTELFSIEHLPIFYLELVTPAEERDLYVVLDSPRTFNVCKPGDSKFAATFFKDQPLAREYAEKYRTALNAAPREEPEGK